MRNQSKLERMYRLSQELELGKDLLSELSIGTQNVMQECEFVDYKREIDQSKLGMAHTVKDIVGLHNSYGGYLVIGVEEVRRDSEYRIVGAQQDLSIETIRGSLERYTGRKLNVRLATHEIEGKDVAIIHVPKRVGRPVCFERDANDAKGLIFKKSQTVFRDGDEVRLAQNADDWEFLNSDRNYPEPSIVDGVNRTPVITHNLPDRSLICQRFVGRSEIISSLWAWLGDEFEYLKILAGEGGRGKTSIAYEFATQVAKNGDSQFEMVLWLTAKKHHFVAIRDEYVAVLESHFESPESLLQRISFELGTASSTDGESITSMKRSAARALLDTPSLIIADNVDTLELEDQRRVIEYLRQVIGRSDSRVLVTTRRDPTLSAEQCIEVPGFPEDEFIQFVENLCDRYQIPQLTKKERSKLYLASDGSPVFTESILRLIKRGERPTKAIDMWQNEAGETVRSAVLRREIEQLSPEARRVLYGLALVDTASLTELRQITQYQENVLQNCLDQLESLFLVQAPRIIESERRFRTPISTARLILNLKNQLIDRKDDIEKRVALLEEKGGKRTDQVGNAIRQTLAMLRENNYSDAHSTVDALIGDNRAEANPDLLLLKGRIYKAEGELDSARNTLRNAFEGGCTKELLFDLWFESEQAANHPQGMYMVAEHALARGDYVDLHWLFRRAESNVRRAMLAETQLDKVNLLNAAADDIAKLIANKSGHERRSYVSNLRDLHDLIWSIASKASLSDGVRELTRALDRKDYRLSIFRQAADSLEELITSAKRDGRSLSTYRKHIETLRSRYSKFMDKRKFANPAFDDFGARLDVLEQSVGL